MPMAEANAVEMSTIKMTDLKKKKKKKKNNNNNKNKNKKKTMPPDRISDLPDCVLVHILSFLPTEDSVLTNLLSKRWRGLWTKVPSLFFSFESWLRFLYERHQVTTTFSNPSFYSRFAQFMYAVLTMYTAGDTTMRNFYLNCGYRISVLYNIASHIRSWVATAIENNVEVFELKTLLEVMSPNAMVLPPKFFTCKTLKVLKLEGVRMIEVPSPMHFPLLKELVLCIVAFQHSKDLTTFLMGCSSVHSLTLSNALWSMAQRNDEDACQGLRLPNLEHLYLVLGEDHYFNHFFDYLTYHTDLLNTAVHNTGKLHSLSMVWRDGVSYRTELPKFQNLRYLRLKLKTLQPKLLTVIFQCDKLESLAIIQENGLKNAVWIEPESVPRCISSCLTTFYFMGYEGSAFDVELLRYIMNNAEIIKKVQFNCVRTLKMEQKYDDLQRLNTFKRASKDCQLFFE